VRPYFLSKLTTPLKMEGSLDKLNVF